MWANLLLLLGSNAARTEVLAASKEILKRYGLSVAKNFFGKLTKEELISLSKKELVDLAELSLKSSGRELIDSKIFSKSNASKLAGKFNQGIDAIENRTRAYLEAKSLTLLTQRGIDATYNPQIRSIRAAFGLKNPKVQELSGFRATKLYRRARGLSSNALEAALFPNSKRQAFGVYYLRGVIGEGTASTLNSLLLGVPRATLATPRARAFVRATQAEIKYLRTVGQIKNASQLSRALKNATAQARNLYGPQDPFYKSKISGYVSGRLTVPLASTYVFVDNDERKKNIQKFNKSIPDFAKKTAKQKARTWVDSYTRVDGIKVKGHYRQLEVAA
jgi:hypothetical protein